jgi:hypothetical protein
MSEVPVSTDPRPVVDGRRLGARWLAGFMAFFWAVVWFGLIDLSVGVQPDPEFQKVYFLELGWGLLFTVLLSVPLMSLAVRVEAPALVWHVLLVGMAMVVTGLTAGYPGQSVLGIAMVIGTGAGIGYLAGVRLWAARPWRADVAMLVLAGILTPFVLAYASEVVTDWRTRAPEITVGMEHRPMQAALAVSTALIAILASFAAKQASRGWRVNAWTVAVTVGWLGLGSVIYPDLEASLGTSHGWAATAWAGLFLLAAEVRGYRNRVLRRRLHTAE